MANRYAWLCGLVVGTLLFSAQGVLAFGTVRGLGQNAEHERITRHALGCGLFTDESCFQQKTLNELAGSKHNFGAIGIPDRGELVPVNKAHCDSGDYLDIPGYPQTAEQAQAALQRCRNWMVEKLHDAVGDAADLVGTEGKLRASQLEMPCLFVGQMKGHAKCNVIEDMGILMHASQDFYSHTNWADIADPSQPVGVENPPGLGNTTRAPWLDLRRSDVEFPPGLLSGCFEKPPEKSHCNYGPGENLHRVKHMVVNKDEGTIDPILGDGITLRGSHDGNFARAVTAAIDDTQDKWSTLRQALVQVYGAKTGALMACAISHDDPMDDCRQ